MNVDVGIIGEKRNGTRQGWDKARKDMMQSTDTHNNEPSPVIYSQSFAADPLVYWAEQLQFISLVTISPLAPASKQRFKFGQSDSNQLQLLLCGVAERKWV